MNISKNRIHTGLGLVMALLALIAVLALINQSRSVNAASLMRLDQQTALQQIQESGDISISRATGKVRFISFDTPMALPLDRGTPTEQRGEAFFTVYGSAFGVEDAANELAYRASEENAVGSRVVYDQVYQGVPVMGGVLYVHLDKSGQMTAVNGTFIPDIKVNPTPSLAETTAVNTAVSTVTSQFPENSPLHAIATELMIFRAGLAKGVPGTSHLVYQVEVADAAGKVREFVYVDAHTGQIVDQITGIHEALDREIYLEAFDIGSLVWQEGDTLPYSGAQAVGINRLIDYAEDTYDLFMNITNGSYDSYDGSGATMRSVYNDPTISCPNANWNGLTTNYCTDVDGDDTVAHEWTHAYTEYTHNLIYQWQPGALNESYSDIFGEAVDMLNAAGLDSPDITRSAGYCSTLSRLSTIVTVNSPAGIAGDYSSSPASFGPTLASPLTADVVAANDGSAIPTEACSPLQNDLTGKIAFVRRGTCAFVDKVNNAQDAGAIGVIVANHAIGGDGTINMSGVDNGITIPSVMVGYTDGNTIEAQLGSGVNATLQVDPAVNAENSVRWLSGEDDPAFGGAIRDMWTPSCYGDPDHVLDSANYFCSAADGGGVHTNSGVPNHAFALLVDGGTHNSIAVAQVGLTKTLAIYWRAMSVYQNPASDFADHADALEQSCADLVGQPIYDPLTGAASANLISAADCTAVSNAMDAVQMREDPATQCGFEPLLANPPAAVCGGMGSQQVFFSEDFESGVGSWATSHDVVYPGATSPDWSLSSSLPGSNATSAFYAINEQGGTCNADSGDHSRVMHLDSPEIVIPANATHARISFWHYVASEPSYDGGNVKISVNGGEWQIVDGRYYTFNPYNTSLATADQGNTNPMASEEAFTGTDEGVLTGSWGQSQVDVNRYAKPGDTIQIRFDFGSDGCGGGLYGWYVDDVEAYYCDGQTDPDVAVFADGVEDYLVSQFELSSVLGEGHSDSHSLEILNTGIQTLDWQIEQENVAVRPSGAEDYHILSTRPVDPAVFAGGRGQIAPASSQIVSPLAVNADVVADGSFEGGTPNANWDEYLYPDDAAGKTPICSNSGCANVSLDGDWYAWYGEWGVQHHAALTQTVSLANTGSAQLTFWLMTADSVFGTLQPSDTLTVTMDGNPVFTIDASQAAAYDLLWTQIEVNISSYADGGDHVLSIEASTRGSWFVDLVAIDYIPCLNISNIPWLDVTQASGSNGRDTSTMVSVLIDSTGLNEGDYTANLCVETNAPDGSGGTKTIAVPVTLQVVVWDIYMPLIFR